MSDENEEAGQLADYDLFALERNYPEAYAPYRMAIRIAELEATVARLTAEPDDVEASEFETAMMNNPAFEGHADIKAALTAFLERRMKG